MLVWFYTLKVISLLMLLKTTLHAVDKQFNVPQSIQETDKYRPSVMQLLLKASSPRTLRKEMEMITKGYSFTTTFKKTSVGYYLACSGEF